MKKIFLTIILIATLTLPVFAQDSIGENEEVSVVSEQDREEQLKGLLNLMAPEYTDNPSHIITFSDPSEEKDGVELDIDEKGYREVDSPYTLPALSIGRHTLKFRFIDDIGATKVYEASIVILPRPPIVKAPSLDNNVLTISGTGLINSQILVSISVNSNNYVLQAETNSDGSWSGEVEFDTTPVGIMTIFAYTRNKGYASNLSEAVVFSASDIDVINGNKDELEDGISFNFNNIELEDLPSIVSSNPDLLIVSVLILVLGFSIGSLLSLLIKRRPTERVSRDIVRKVKGKKRKEERTLMEIFAEEVQSEENEKEEKKKDDELKEKVFTKKDFLKDFNKFDPDNEKGQSKKSPKKKDKKEVLVTLTSKSDEE